MIKRGHDQEEFGSTCSQATAAQVLTCYAMRWRPSIVIQTHW